MKPGPYGAGEIAAHGGDTKTAGTTSYRQALTLAEELGMRPLQAHCHYSLGTLYRQTGNMQQTRAALGKAMALYRDMAMMPWLPQVASILAQVEVE